MVIAPTIFYKLLRVFHLADYCGPSFGRLVGWLVELDKLSKPCYCYTATTNSIDSLCKSTMCLYEESTC